MASMIFNPLEEYEKRLKKQHEKVTADYFKKLLKQSKVDIDQNRKTVKEYDKLQSSLKKLRRKFNFWRVLRVIMIITVILILLVIWKITPKIRALREEIANSDKKAAELLSLAEQQMLPLNRLFGDRDCLALIEETVPLIGFAERMTVEQELNMRVNFDYGELDDIEQSTLDVLAGSYNDNPFVFENKLVHTMGLETYHGSKTISWTETYVDTDGKTRTRSRTETLHASVTKPKPFYSTQVVLNYGAQGGDKLCFSRDATHLEQKSERALEKHIEKGEKRLKKRSDKAIASGDDFTGMSNTEFEVLFDALDRTDEVQYRTLFTPLAQTNMVDLILSKTGYGDDFNFYKLRRMNKIVSNHSQGRQLLLAANSYKSYSYDIIKENFEAKNAEYFKAVYFDLAPLLAIPLYQERPVHSLNPIPEYTQLYSQQECESLINAADERHFVHPDTKTAAILKVNYLSSANGADESCVTAYSYDILQQVDYISVRGGDGHYHNVPVYWDDYIPLEARNIFRFAASGAEYGKALSGRNGLMLYNLK